MIKWFKDDNNEIRVSVYFVTIIVIGISIFYGYHFRGGISPEHTAWAEFGAFFGGVTGSVLAFMALLVLLRTLDVNKNELRETRKLLEQQNFDSIFFNLLKLQNTILEKVELKMRDFQGEQQFAYGRDAIRELVETFQAKYLHNEMRGDRNLENDLQRHQEAIRKFNNSYGYSYFHIYQFIKNICEVIHSANLNESVQEKYIGILRSQLSKYEILLLFYNTLNERNAEKSIPLMVEFDLLKNLDKDSLLDYFDTADRMYELELSGDLLFCKLMEIFNEQ